MKNIKLKLIFVVIMGLLISCSSVPKKSPILEAAKESYKNAQADPDVMAHSQVPMYDASKTLAQAEKAETVEDMELMDRIGKKLERQVQLAKFQAEQKVADNKLEILKKENQKLLFEAREKKIAKSQIEIEAKQKETALARQQTEAMRKEAELARQQNEKMKKEAESKALEAESKALEAEKMKKEAEAKALEAEQLRKEAEKAKEEAKKFEQELLELQAKQTDRGMVLTIGDVLFESGKTDLKAGAMLSIDKLSEFLHKNPTRNVLIEGHTDSKGSDSLNLSLSERRADSVKNALIARGIDRDRITIKGYGKTYPITDNTTSTGRQQNRRVEIVILNEGVPIDSVLRK
ncbi:MAG: OmpA family protein [Desulfobacterales bacterium]|nr:OmpA family protein [Desulfobacterales bacterium]